MLHPSMVRGPGEIDTATFFGDMCPRALALRAAGAAGGRVAFFLSGDRGGTWVIDLSANQVEAGPPRRAVDLVCVMGVDDFEEMLRGRLDAAAAMEAGDLEISGERDILLALSDVFTMA